MALTWPQRLQGPPALPGERHYQGASTRRRTTPQR
jgi:hypothetical protein